MTIYSDVTKAVQGLVIKNWSDQK